MVKKFAGLLKKRDPEKQERQLWFQFKKWLQEPGSNMSVEDALFKKTSLRGDTPSTSNTRSLDPVWRLSLPGSGLLEETDEKKRNGHLTTHLLWPTRVSVVNLIEEGLLTATENDALSTACSEAYDRFVKKVKRGDGSKHRRGSIDNGAFFHDQAEEIYDPDLKRQGSKSFGKSPTWAAVLKLWELQHNLSREHILAAHSGTGARSQRNDDFRRNVMFPWCALYVAGTDHSAHVHEDSIVSGVYYSQAPHGSSPLVFSDPRGGSSMETSGQKAQTFMPAAPFHHQYHFYPKAGDMIIFPSYLVHQVPPNSIEAADSPRIAWPFNLFADLDAWSRLNM